MDGVDAAHEAMASWAMLCGDFYGYRMFKLTLTVPLELL